MFALGNLTPPDATNLTFAWDSIAQTQQMYQDGVDVTDSITNAAGLVGFRTRLTLLANAVGGIPFLGDISQLWFDDSFVDLSGGGISKFYQGPNTFVDLGPNGENPLIGVTDALPAVYFGGNMTANTGGNPANGTGPGWNGGANLGSVNGFALFGTPFTDSTV